MSNYKDHALAEFKAAGWDLKEDPMQQMICDNVLEMLEVFDKYGHSGSSAPYTVNLFKKLALFEPIAPLTGEDDEWIDHGNGLFQNKRCSHVFKDVNKFDGQAYDADAVVFREPDGVCVTSYDSAQPITFPYNPKTVIVDRK